MSLHADLLIQARFLANREPRRPRQASLRRAISTAYYAMFHLLVSEATTRLIAVPALRGRCARAFEHGDMKSACRAFASAQPNQLGVLTGGVAIPGNVQQVAATFLELQEARHEADYNTDATFTRLETNNLVTRAEQAFADWRAVRADPVSQMFLAALLFWKKWSR